ncbi:MULTISPECIES: proteasome assembly chaperone family protein [Halobacterium]|uniref:proteasome assembly chaperone family protein n=1 Tax=Halobacterium TaxID=2239 RepID=UPI001966454D|nr:MULTISPECIES: proteasome assembly chaperone family protein [Halobacterium]MCF2165632.1 proteasome assembly chaperone family protein [Halobacterium salinarum]MCF2168908.1 proteasome assembly chaperone family protein [Halobacterium salinarum]MCF2207826.1 proteasome assembly chaperone family protein [Halobacterium salinarum]MCF2238928.1 proteasome assembly chaperone family protein [Halobacterium salinarum]MDL0120622.1 proteasome assembly chaperone family protein [Halobacterium salinarum]
MDELSIEWVAEPSLDDPALVEGLPGVGHVGKLVAEHVIAEADSELVCRVHSEYFPPQVTVGDDSVAELAAAEIHAVETSGRDLLVVTGDHQAQDTVGQYRVTEAFLDAAAEFDATDVFSLGGVPTGELVEDHDVIGAVSSAALKDGLADAGVEFRSEEPAGGIVGSSGLLVGLGGKRGFDAACLMGETSGYLVDPKAAKAVLAVLGARLDFEMDEEALDDRAEEMEEVVSRLQDMEETPSPGDEDLRYIG